jgi:hypothetical protein
MTEEQTIKLGKEIIELLLREPSEDDLLSRWMAHYVAEQMADVERETGSARQSAKDRCFHSILTLWQHRASLPKNKRPFGDFEPIFEALARLSPKNPRPYYYQERKPKPPEVEAESKTVKNLIDFALALDSATRVLIEEVLHAAAELAANDSTRTFLQLMASDGERNDVSAVRILLTHFDTTEAKAADGKAPEKIEIESRINKLNLFIELSTAVRDELKGKLQ